MSLMVDLGQRAGLAAINGLAKLSRYKVEKDIKYGPHLRNSLDHYQPLLAPRASIVFFYGGGWSNGDKHKYTFAAEALCGLGFEVFVPDYRLYPQVKFTAISEDACAAMDLAMAKAQAPLFVMGHSAGAQIAALLTVNKSLLASVGRSRDALTGFIGMAGPYDFFPFTEDGHDDLFGPEPLFPQSQPVNFADDQAPPMLLLHGKDDNRVRRGNSKSLMLKVQDKGGRAQRKVYPGMSHVGMVISLAKPFRRGNSVLHDVDNFVVQCLAGR